MRNFTAKCFFSVDRLIGKEKHINLYKQSATVACFIYKNCIFVLITNYRARL